MKSRRWLPLCAFVLSLLPSPATADEPSPAEQARRRVEDGLVKPLVAAENDANSFSRARRAPRERRVRVTQAVATLDKFGKAFFAYAVDVRFGDQWRENDIVGCAYPASGAIFVKRPDGYRPASYLLGKNAEPTPGVCEAAPRAPRS